MTNRTRERFIPRGQGFSTRFIAPNTTLTNNPLQTETVCHPWWSRCVDVSGLPHQDHPLTITERDQRALTPLTGHEDQSGGSYIEYANYVSSGQRVVPSHLSISIPSIGTRATTLMARSNPNREEVSIPNFIHELKDLPGMYRDILKFKTRLKSLKDIRNSKEIANYHLSAQMGWLPMISDIRKMLHFQALADKRVLELQRLYSSSGLKRRLNLFDSSTSSTANIVADSSLGSFINVHIDIVTRKRSWGTIRWIPTSVPKDIGHQALGRTARKLVFGTNHIGFDAVQAWNALPWTWLIDWFTNFNEWLQAHRNDVPVQPTGPCNIMTLTETYEVWRRTDGHVTIKGNEGMRVLRTKERAQSSGSLSVSVPLLNGRQWSILSALALQRLKVR